MAKIGLKYPVYKSTSGAGTIAKAIQADIAITTNDVKLYADDAIAESDVSFASGTLTLGIDELSDDIIEILLGHVKGDVSEELVANINDLNPYVGVGFYGVKVVNGTRKYRAIYLPKIKFAEPADNLATKGETLAFGTDSLVGTIFPDDNGDWKQEKTFALESDAIAYLQTKAGIATSASTGLSALSMTGTGGTLSPAFGAAVRYYTFGGVTGASVTVTATAANHTIKLYVDGVYSQELASGAASAAITMAIGTKKLTLVAYEAGKSSQTTEIVVVKTA